MIEVNELKVFVKAAREKSFTLAGEKLFMAQSNISTLIAKLEKKTGVVLFQRSREGVELTESGEKLFPLANEILRLVDQAEKSFEQDNEPSGTLHIGSMESIAIAHLMLPFKKFTEIFPQVKLQLHTADTTEQIQLIKKGYLRIAFAGEAQIPAGFKAIPVLNEELVLVRLKNQNIGNKFLVLPEGCSFRMRLEKYLGKKKGQFYVMKTIHSCRTRRDR